jgi:hypothetical protein
LADATVEPVLVGRSAQAAGGRNAILAAVAVAIFVVFAGLAQAAVPIGSDFRISNVGPDNDPTRGALDSAVAYNSRDNEYLVVWWGDGLATPGKFEIFGQRISAATGSQIGGDFPISSTGPSNDAAYDAVTPAVAYNPQENQYLVVWYAVRFYDAGAVGSDKAEVEIFGQLLSASGQETGTNDFRISTTGTDGDVLRDAFDPTVAYNSQANEYLVTWEADKLNAGEFEIFGRRISATGPDGSITEFRISNVGAIDAARDAEFPAIAYNSQANQYLVVWHGDGLPGPPNDGKLEVFGQLVSSGGAEVGSDFQISNAGGTQAAIFAWKPTVAYGSQPNEYLVAWEGNLLLGGNAETEIYGQRVSSAGTELGGDFRISSAGPDGDRSRDAQTPGSAYNAAANQYVVVWDADALTADDEFEIFGQSIASTGAEVGGDFRISMTGTDGDSGRGAFAAAIASSTRADEHLVTWWGDGLAVNGEHEIFGHRLGVPPSSTTPPTTPPANPGTPTQLRLSVRAKRFQRALRTKVLTLRVTCNVRCATTTTARVSVPRVRASRTFRLRAVRRTLAPSRTRTIRVRLTRNAIRAARRALRKRKRVTARVTVTARDGGGNRRSARRAIRIRR